jgi:ribosome recycling factor
MSNTNFDEFGKKAESTISFLSEELKKIRSGRAAPSIVEDIDVEAYGTTQPIKNIGNISVADPTLLVIQPWDKSLLPNIVKAIVAENLGLNPQINGDVIRVPMPPLTEERRKEYVKLMKEKLEEARIGIRNVRKEILTSLKSDQEQGVITEDDLERYEKELQKLVDRANQEIEKKGETKEQELMTI